MIKLIQEEYEEIVSRSPSPVPRTPVGLGTPSGPLSREDSQDSLASEPEQMTVSRRPGAEEEYRYDQSFLKVDCQL